MKSKYLFCTAFLLLNAGVQGGVLVPLNEAPISDEERAIATSPPLPSKARRLIGQEQVIRPEEEDFVPEKIVERIRSQLNGWGEKSDELNQGLLDCAALHASEMLGKKSACLDEFTGQGDLDCLHKHHYGKKSIGQSLMADRFDLNGDGKLDYIVSDRYYCNALSANQSNVYFVLLSQPAGDFRLAYAEWASFGLEVVKAPRSGNNVLIERSGKTDGIYTRILEPVDGRFRLKTCVEQDSQGTVRRCL